MSSNPLKATTQALALALLAMGYAPPGGAFDTNPAAGVVLVAPGSVAGSPHRTAGVGERPTPLPTLDDLQGWRPAIRGRVETPEPALRERAVRETGLQVGSQAALATISHEQNAEVETFAPWLDEIYRFDQLLMEQGLVLPPIVIEARRHAEVEGLQLAKIEQSYQLLENAQVVSAPPTWRDYLIAPDYPPPVKPEGALLPQNADEERLWTEAVRNGWTQGEQQAELALKARVGELHRAFLGRVRYRVLLARGLVTAPAVRVARRGVKLSGNELLIGRTEVTLSRLPHFRGPTRTGRLPWTALPEVLTTYDDGSSVQ